MSVNLYLCWREAESFWQRGADLAGVLLTMTTKKARWPKRGHNIKGTIRVWVSLGRGLVGRHCGVMRCAHRETKQHRRKLSEPGPTN